MDLKLLAFLPLLLGVCAWEETAKDSQNSTHRPVVSEGSLLPLRSELSLASVKIYDDGRVVIPMAVQHLNKHLTSKDGLRDSQNTTHRPVVPEGGLFPLRSGHSRGAVQHPNRQLTSRNGCPGQDIPAMCGTYQLTAGQTMTITTPNYPQNYPTKFKCTWKFESADQDELSFTCQDFLLDQKKDYLSVKHNANPAKKYKRNKSPSIASTNGGVLDLKFLSDKKVTRRGFKCTVNHLGTPPTTTTTSTTTTSTTPTPTTTTTTPTPTTTTTPEPLSHPLCGLINTRIVNGAETSIHEYPWMAWTHLRWSNGSQRWCGGTIIHEQWILTAAHCAYRLNDAQNAVYKPNYIGITVGAHLMDNHEAHGGYIVEVDVNHIHMHPNYQMPYDIALYKLMSPLTFTQNVAPICLAPRAWAPDDMAGKAVTLSGWGKTETGHLSSYLRDYNTVGYNFAACESYYGSWMGPTQMCTDGTAQKHSCAGDSGGPVIYQKGSRTFQVGVISFGGSDACNDQAPDGQVRVAAFIAWFESITGLTFPI